MSTWLVTGAAGFIGSHVARRLLADGERVIGLDNLNDYYDPALKLARIALLEGTPGWTFAPADLADDAAVGRLFARHRPQTVVNLAAQAGVRHSLVEPRAYIQANVVGFLTILEHCRHHEVGHLVYASSSSVYGAASRLPFSVHDPADHPASMYAVTKRANELMAHSYSHLFGLPTTGLRFFTVYGPWGRPDMAYYAFGDAILAGRPITVFGDGSALRDFTYVDDIVEGLVRVARRPAKGVPTWSPEHPDPGTSYAPWQVFNIGHGEQASVNRLIDLLEAALGRRAERVTAPDQPGDLRATHADVTDLLAYVDFAPQVRLEEGIGRFAEWLRGWSGPQTSSTTATGTGGPW